LRSTTLIFALMRRTSPITILGSIRRRRAATHT
jgi:hypothetical protein